MLLLRWVELSIVWYNGDIVGKCFVRCSLVPRHLFVGVFLTGMLCRLSLTGNICRQVLVPQYHDLVSSIHSLIKVYCSWFCLHNANHQMGCISYRCGFQEAAGIDVHQGEAVGSVAVSNHLKWTLFYHLEMSPDGLQLRIQQTIQQIGCKATWSLERYPIMWVGCWRASWACLRRITTGGGLLKGFTMSLSHESHDIYVDGNSWD